MKTKTRSQPTLEFRSTLIVAASLALLAITPPAEVHGAHEHPGQADPAAESDGPITNRPDEARIEPRTRRADGRRPGAGGPLGNRLDPAQRELLRRFIEEHFPQMHVELERLRSEDPQKFMMRMRRIAPEMRRTMEVMEHDPERGALMIHERRLDMDLRRLARRYRHAQGDAQRERLRQRFREVCEEAIDCRHRRRAMEIRELEERITELKQRHAEADRLRDRLVREMVEERLERGERRPGSPDGAP